MTRTVESRRAVAFLRAINVGGRRVKMDRLREIFEALGLGPAETYIASGNVVFEAPPADPADLESAIERDLEKSLGYGVDTFVRSAEEVDAISRREMFPEVDRGPNDRVHVILLKGTPEASALSRLGGVAPDGDMFLARPREILWLRRGPLMAAIGNSDLVGATLGETYTMRNLNTLVRIVAKFFP